MTYKTQGIIAKCLKQFDLRLFEEIGGNIQEKNQKWKNINKDKKSTLRAFASRAKKKSHQNIQLGMLLQNKC